MMLAGHSMDFTIDDIVDQLNHNKENGHSCVMLIGAGCSKSAGIPLASEIVDIIRKNHRRCYDRAKPQDYPHCMGQLSDSVRRDLINGYVDGAKTNWAHIAIAQMMKAEYVDRILTTNFDPLVARACALVDKYPAVYDMTTVRNFRRDFVSNLAVFHLHGQRDGFAQFHDPEEVESHRNVLEPVFQNTADHRTWIVIGYSGKNDPVV
jgi:NAD-dependent SIR2 family protein deacetylase